ncbi:TonB family protein [Mucilaginibacter sp. HMF5004]|uniref:energy transducer TonB n=1 Tax=Mucilaginibacter rivuli TaxID=2857527 RepID=UPI001C5F8445|nr:energy transducer TonB [Mucilaginibacter rivuli]MBW4889075.1 TonB family protein [Mucilaginibacter rivuli]
MFGSKLDIMKSGWLNLVFANRNQAYGAYQLRKDNARNTNKAMLITLSGFLCMVAVPTIANMLTGYTPPPIERKIDIDNKIIKIIPEITKPIKQLKEQPAQQLKNKTIEYKEYKPVEDIKAANPPTDVQVSKAEVSNKTIEGNEKGAINTGQQAGTNLGPTTNGTGVSENTTEGPGEVFVTAEFEPTPIGGMEKFYTFLGSKIRYPNAAKESGTQGRAVITFIVEKDGSLTDIKAVRDPGNGLADEAIRVLKLSPKWKPGMQNGRAVRVQYTIPVNFSLGD